MSVEFNKSLEEIRKRIKESTENADALAGEAKEAEPQKEFTIKNGAYIRVSEDNMTAWIYLNPPLPGEKFYSVSDIYDFIRENGVVHGFHKSNIAAIAKKHVYEREIVIAKGDRPIEGVDGYYEWKIDAEKKKSPTIRPDGTVDYSSMRQVPTIEKGDVIAVYHHAVNAKNGFDVRGKEINTLPAKDLQPLKGRGITNDKDPDVYVASLSGRIEVTDKKNVDIKSEYQIEGDVDLVTGKVEFFGDIHITGNVASGVIIRASRNILIDGFVEGATIYAGGDIQINRGISGGQKGKITAKGSVVADFIEHCTVEAGGIVRANSFIDATVYSGETVVAEGKNGSIIGGNVRGLLGVIATSLGNETGTKTTVASGYSGDEYAEYLELYQKETDTQKILSETVDYMTNILKEKRLGKNLNSEENDKMLLALNEKKDEYFDMLDKVRAEKEALGAIIEKGKGGMVLANDKIFIGVTVIIEGNVFRVMENSRYMRYKNEGGRITGSVIVVT